MLTYLRYSLCLLLMVAATCTDIKSKRIPNWITLPFLGLGLSVSLIFNDWLFALYTIVSCLVLFCLGYFGVMGMGDIKLCMAISSLIEFKYFLWLIGAGTLVMIAFWFAKYGQRAVKESKTALFALLTQNLQAINPNGTKMIYAPFLTVGFLIAATVKFVEGGFML